MSDNLEPPGCVCKKELYKQQTSGVGGGLCPHLVCCVLTGPKNTASIQGQETQELSADWVGPCSGPSVQAALSLGSPAMCPALDISVPVTADAVHLIEAQAFRNKNAFVSDRVVKIFPHPRGYAIHGSKYMLALPWRKQMESPAVAQLVQQLESKCDSGHLPHICP